MAPRGKPTRRHRVWRWAARTSTTLDPRPRGGVGCSWLLLVCIFVAYCTRNGHDVAQSRQMDRIDASVELQCCNWHELHYYQKGLSCVMISLRQGLMSAAEHSDGLASDRLSYLSNPIWWAGMATSTYVWS